MIVRTELRSDTQPVDLAGMTTDEHVGGWWEYWRRFRGDRAERKALELGEPQTVVRAHDLVAELVDNGGREGLEIIVALIDAAPDDGELVTVGAGPLEDFLNVCADPLVDQVERLARRSPRFRTALRSTILPDRLHARFAPLLGR